MRYALKAQLVSAKEMQNNVANHEMRTRDEKTGHPTLGLESARASETRCLAYGVPNTLTPNVLPDSTSTCVPFAQMPKQLVKATISLAHFMWCCEIPLLVNR